MTCRHSLYDPACGSYESNLKRLKQDFEAQFGDEKDSTKFVIESYEEIAPYLILKVTYPSCKNCSYEGTKLMVFKDVSLLRVMQWRNIDPHFRETLPEDKFAAPSPVARFPATEEGMQAARAFVNAMIIPG